MQKHPDLPQAFADLGVEVRFLKALHKIGFVEPTEIQRHLIPIALTGRDILGQARTGTGKTAAFTLPMLQRLDPAGRLQALCLVPTRELAVQVAGEMVRLAEFADLHVAAVYGGQKVATQIHQLGRKPHVVVGTPGRVWDFIQRRVLTLDSVTHVILDEVDRMLDIGFRDDIKTILSKVTGEHQTIFASATIDDEIKLLAKRYTKDPLELNVSRDRLTVDNVDQSYVTVEAPDKFSLLRRIIEVDNPSVAIVFCNTKAAARKLAKKLHDAGIDTNEIHGDLMQHKRERVMARFRKHQIRVLVATDLAARGIDVSSISHIINYHIPPDPHIYVHRIGRTGRMGARGIAITFVTREEGPELTKIEMLINREIPQLHVDGFSPSQTLEPRTAPPAEQRMFTRFQQPIHTGTEEAAHKPLPKTLGSRFRTARSRRRP